MELLAYPLYNLLRREAVDFAFLDFARAAVDDVVPLRLGVSIHIVIETGDELTGEIRAVLLREGQHFGYFLSSDAHAGRISRRASLLASLDGFSIRSSL